MSLLDDVTMPSRKEGIRQWVPRVHEAIEKTDDVDDR